MKPKSCSLVKQNQHAKLPSYRPIVIFRLFKKKIKKINYLKNLVARASHTYV